MRDTAAFRRHRHADPHCSCNDCLEWQEQHTAKANAEERVRAFLREHLIVVAPESRPDITKDAVIDKVIESVGR